ncbi:MAG TPA: hypothetical protein VFI65_01965 [Streptosporangiaceae bacterium]|nr:hypothetical protein [Streptosporangiaceae bacterium]
MTVKTFVRMITATVALAVAAGGSVAAGAATAASGPGWRIVATVGSASRGETPGARVVATGATDAFAYWQCTQCSIANRNRNFIEHWNGRAWRRIALPVPLNFGNFLISIDASSASNLWAITSANRAGVWNGSKWSVRSIPRWALVIERSGDLGGQVVVLSPSNVWIFSQHALAAHFLNGTWHKVALPAVGAFSFTKVTASDIWGTAITTKSARTTHPVFTMLHWDGSAWHTLALPAVKTAPGTIPGYTLMADGRRSLWLTRLIEGPAHRTSAALLHWNGSWHTIKAPSGLVPADIATDGAGGVWIAGERSLLLKSAVEGLYHYRSGGWTRHLVPTKKGMTNILLSVTSIPGTHSLWANGLLAGKGGIEIGDIMKFGP